MTTGHHIVLPVETRPIEELRDGARRTPTVSERDYSPTSTKVELVQGIDIIEQINAHMQTDDNHNEARIVSIYHVLKPALYP